MPARQLSVTIPYCPRAIFRPYHATTKRYSALVAHRRAGKALDIATPIPMADGTWKLMGALVDGDSVLDDRGYPCTVVAAHPVQIGRPCYAVKFNDGAEIVCDEDHLWFTQTKLNRSHHVGVRRGLRGAAKYVSRTHAPKGGTVKTTAQIRDTILYQGERNHSIPLAGAAQYPTRDLPVDPYIVGLWLGDGTARNSQFTTMDEEIRVALDECAQSIGCSLRLVHSANSGRASTYSIAGTYSNSLTARFRALNLLQNKHIPEMYLQADVAQRTALLHGLMDTDGSIGRTSQCEITQKSERLTDDVVALVHSLGATLGRGRKVINGTTYHRVLFRPSFNPFRLARKALCWSPPDATRAFSQKRYIVAVDAVSSRPVRCITVDSASRLYLAGRHFVPTHNTVAPLNKLIKGALTCKLPAPRFAYIAPLRNQAKDIAWGYVREFSQPIPGVEFNEAELRADYPNGGRVRLYGADNPDALRGIYLDGVVLDEYGSMRPSLWDAVIQPCLSDRGGWADFCGTPNGRNHFCKIYEDAVNDPEWYAAMHKASQTGILPPDELAARRKAMTPDRYAQEYECSFEAAVIGAYYGREMREAMDEGRICAVPYERAKPVETWWDLGVGDSTAIWFAQRIGTQIRLIDFYEASGEGLQHYAKVLQAKPYVYSRHIAPHDIEVRELGSEAKSRKTIGAELGIKFEVAPRLSIDDGINAVRMLIPTAWFDREKCAHGLECLRQYQKAYDEAHDVFSDRPLHSWASHAADAMRYGAVMTPPDPAWGKKLKYDNRGLV